MRLNTTLVLVLSTCMLSAQQIAITFDDAPFGYSAGMSDTEKIEAFDKILHTLKKHKVKATFMVTSGNMNESTKTILDCALKAGHQLGNHTHRHKDLNRTSAAEYIADIDSCQELAGKWMNTSYFRYAMLHRGNTAAKRDSVYAYLKSNGYVVAPVTIDNNEWVYNKGYSLARRINDHKKMEQLGKEYLYHMKEVTSRYQKLSLQLTDREIPQILLLHVNPINSEFLGELLDWYKRDGWEFITMDEALKDEFYSIEDDYVGPYGFSQLDRIKKDRAGN
ncbi:MAG: polysaccharide deacetylase family protein [Cyclobacteriaceae bacterium]